MTSTTNLSKPTLDTAPEERQKIAEALNNNE